MTASNLMQIVALTAAMGLIGSTIAADTGGTTSGSDRSTISSSGMDTPSSGAIVTPEDKAMWLRRDAARTRSQNGDVSDDTSTSNDNASNENELRVKPGRADMDRAASGYDNGTSTLDENQSAPARTGSDAQPGDMGPGNVRGQ